MQLKTVVGWLLVAFAIYCAIDPFSHSSLSGFPNFVSYEVKLPDTNLIPTNKDPFNLLQKSDIILLGQIQGPESLAFDPLGRGPYTGVADGRILFWDGSKWTQFAVTSSNR